MRTSLGHSLDPFTRHCVGALAAIVDENAPASADLHALNLHVTVAEDSIWRWPNDAELSCLSCWVLRSAVEPVLLTGTDDLGAFFAEELFLGEENNRCSFSDVRNGGGGGDGGSGDGHVSGGSSIISHERMLAGGAAEDVVVAVVDTSYSSPSSHAARGEFDSRSIVGAGGENAEKFVRDHDAGSFPYPKSKNSGGGGGVFGIGDDETSDLLASLEIETDESVDSRETPADQGQPDPSTPVAVEEEPTPFSNAAISLESGDVAVSSRNHGGGQRNGQPGFRGCSADGPLDCGLPASGEHGGEEEGLKKIAVFQGETDVAALERLLKLAVATKVYS